MKTFKQFMAESEDFENKKYKIIAFLESWGYEQGDYQLLPNLDVEFKVGFSSRYASYADVTALRRLPFNMISIGGDLELAMAPNLESLSEFPKTLPWSFTLDGAANIGTLVGGPERVGLSVRLGNLKNLTSLEGFPKPMGKSLQSISLNNLNNVHTLDGICDTSALRIFGPSVKMSLKGIEKLCPSLETLIIERAEITDSVLGLFEIPSFTHIKTLEQQDWVDVVNDHLKSGDVFSCQEELVSLGLDSFAEM